MNFDFLKNGAQSIGNVFKGSSQQGNNLFSNLQTPSKLNLGNSYNANVNNTGNYSLPTQTSFGQTNTSKPLGDYSFTKNASEYVPNTEFAQNIADTNTNPWKTALSNGLQSFSEGGTQGNTDTPIAVTGFQFENGQIKPAQQLKSNLYNFLVR